MRELPVLSVYDDVEQARYVVTLDGAPAGYSYYRIEGDAVVFLHTEVDPAFGGHGVGSALAAGSLDDVRSRGLGVVPLCPFIATFIDKHPAYADLVVPRPGKA